MHSLRQPMAAVCLLVLVAGLGWALPASAQEGFVAGSVGVDAGEGTSATFSLSGGYLISPRFGLEIEFSATPDVERDIPIPAIQNLPQIPSSIGPTVFPGFQIDRTGTLYSFHTSAVVPLWTRRNVCVAAVAGGGTGTLSERVRVHRDAYELPGLLGFPGLTIPAIDVTSERSHTGLSIQTAGTVDIGVNRHIAVGADVRYQHVFLADDALNLVRVAGRVRWRF